MWKTKGVYLVERPKAVGKFRIPQGLVCHLTVDKVKLNLRRRKRSAVYEDELLSH